MPLFIVRSCTTRKRGKNGKSTSFPFVTHSKIFPIEWFSRFSHSYHCRTHSTFHPLHFMSTVCHECLLREKKFTLASCVNKILIIFIRSYHNFIFFYLFSFFSFSFFFVWFIHVNILAFSTWCLRMRKLRISHHSLPADSRVDFCVFSFFSHSSSSASHSNVWKLWEIIQTTLKKEEYIKKGWGEYENTCHKFIPTRVCVLAHVDCWNFSRANISASFSSLFKVRTYVRQGREWNNIYCEK